MGFLDKKSLKKGGKARLFASPTFAAGLQACHDPTSTTEFHSVWSREKALMTQNWLIGQQICARRAELFWAKRRSCQNPASSSWQQQQQVWTENHSSCCKSLRFLGFWFRRIFWPSKNGPILMAQPWVSRMRQCSTCYPPGNEKTYPTKRVPARKPSTQKYIGLGYVT